MVRSAQTRTIASCSSSIESRLASLYNTASRAEADDTVILNNSPTMRIASWAEDHPPINYYCSSGSQTSTLSALGLTV